MNQIFGSASDFYTVKIYRIEEIMPPELEWTEFSAYVESLRKPEAKTEMVYQVQVIDITDGSVVKKFDFQNYSDALLKYEEIYDDLKECELTEFNQKYGISRGE